MTSGIVRRGDRLLRPVGAWSPAVHEYLRYLEGAGPVSPLADLADAAWTFVPLAPRGQLTDAGFDLIPDLPARLRMFVEANGPADRKAIVPALERSMTGAAGRPGNAVDAASLQWLQGESTILARALFASPAPRSSLSSSLIRQRSGMSAEHRPRPRGRGHRRCWPAVNARPQTWKACWGQPLKSSNLLSSASRTCGSTSRAMRTPRGRASPSSLEHLRGTPARP
jgi:hypothetical protein